MSIRGKIYRRASAPPAQGVVEFALILPFLLVLVLGVMEVARLLFIYSAVASASREAARYGSAGGDNGAGVARYIDCAGMRAAAKRIGSLAGVQDSDITIEYDSGPGSDPFDDSCPPTQEIFGGWDRVVVQVSAHYRPILPLVNLPDFPIVSRSARTVYSAIPVAGTLVTPTPHNTRTPTPPPPTATTEPPPPTDTTEPPPPTDTTEPPPPSDTATETLTATWGPSSTPTATLTPTPSTTSTSPSTTLTPTQTPTLTPTPACNGISAYFDPPSANSLALKIRNASPTNVMVLGLTVSWPNSASQNKYLNTIYMQNEPVWDSYHNSQSPLTVVYWLSGTDNLRTIAAGNLNGSLSFYFEKNAENSGYTVSLAFDNGCSLSNITR